MLNKREENALSQAMADNNARVIDSADGSGAPIAPQRNRIILLGLLVGIALPGVGCLLVLFMDTRVHGRKDVERLLACLSSVRYRWTRRQTAVSTAIS